MTQIFADDNSFHSFSFGCINNNERESDICAGKARRYECYVTLSVFLCVSVPLWLFSDKLLRSIQEWELRVSLLQSEG